MQEPKFPYDAWALSPTMRVHKVVVTGVASSPAFRTLADGRTLKRSEIFANVFRAMEAGHQILDENQKAIDKKQVKLDARRINLDKALEKHAAVHA